LRQDIEIEEERRRGFHLIRRNSTVSAWVRVRAVRKAPAP